MKRSAEASTQASKKQALATAPSGALDMAAVNAPQGTGSWSVRSHVTTKDGKAASIFALFSQNGDAFTVNFAVVDPADKQYHLDSVADSKSVAALKALLDSNQLQVDDVLKQALGEQLAKGQMPLPARTVDAEAKAAAAGLDISLAGNSLKATDNGFAVCCSNADGSVKFNLALTADSAAIKGHSDGNVRSNLFSAFVPRLSTSGSLTVNGQEAAVSGQSWFERRLVTKAAEVDGNFNVLSVSLNNGSSISVVNNTAVCIAADGTRSEHPATMTAVNETSTEKYRSMSTITGEHFPCKWQVAVPAAGVELNVSAPFESQELVYALPAATAWTGRVSVQGTVGGAAVEGTAFLEQQRSSPIRSFEGCVSKFADGVRASIDSIMPREPTEEQVAFLMAEPGFEHFMHGVSREVFRDCIVTPLRDIVDRGMTSWRSLVTMLCIEAAGANSDKFKHWLAMPELMTVGSLIIDDIEDEDNTRRGGKASHLEHGLDIAINAGTAAYFMSLYAMNKRNPELPMKTRLRLYETYFVVLRAGHTGQAFDMAGFDKEVQQMLGSGSDADKKLLQERVLAVHRLKTAVPSSCLAKMGAMCAGGSEAAIKALEAFVEHVGIAASIVRSTHNLTSKQGTRPAGKEVAAGKVTSAVSHALCSLPQAQAKELYAKVQAAGKAEGADKQAAVKDVVALVQGAGGDKAAMAQAKALAEEGWKQLDAALPSSWAKIMLRSFGLYALSPSQWDQ